jgi:hypothetical protein
MSVLLTGAGVSLDFVPSTLPNFVAEYDFGRADKAWEDIARTDPAVVGNTIASVVEASGTARMYEQGTAANEPTLANWGNGQVGAFIADSTDRLTGNASVRAASNNVSGWTVAMVIELPPVLGATFSFYHLTTNAGSTKFHIYMDAANNFGLQTRRVNTDATSAVGFGTVDETGGGRAIVIASVNYSDAAGVLEVNGSTTGRGVSGTFAWATGATCEALDAQAANWMATNAGANPVTLGTVANPIEIARAVTAAERALIRDYLNGRYQVY